MLLSVELTFYPFTEDHIPVIKSVIAHLNTFADIRLKTFPTASVLMGDYDKVMAVVHDTVAWSYREHGRCVFIAKFLPEYTALKDE